MNKIFLKSVLFFVFVFLGFSGFSSVAFAGESISSWLPVHGFAAGLGVGTEGIGIQGTTAIFPRTLNLN